MKGKRSIEYKLYFTGTDSRLSYPKDKGDKSVEGSLMPESSEMVKQAIDFASLSATELDNVDVILMKVCVCVCVR